MPHGTASASEPTIKQMRTSRDADIAGATGAWCSRRWAASIGAAQRRDWWLPWGWNVSDRDDFLAWVGSRLRDAEIALHNGDAGPRRAIWSRDDPVTVLGAWKSATGQQELTDLFAQLEASFSDCTSYAHEIIAADVIGEMAYTVGYEHTQASVDGAPRKYTVRATQVYRREDGEWKVAHRHADTVPDAGESQRSR
jgi:ketosteroid isomerase-like protein